ncbi:peptidoglycan-binding domain-containing protein [Streptomyces justiciae]|uniref:peptidoglycan-binding domain-containing protein n=1 Tax=Streptomyces justiciae TaxID=2780140 RepID=UPI002AD4C1D8|nr:peptidoglycan-binding protein [Streptomyces justiciae]
MSDGYVRGYDTYVGDWGDEGVLKLGGSNSNAVCLWQTVLWAEGAQEIDGTSFDQADIDGIFGRNTELATSSMQGRWDLEYVDGIVGSTTFGRADDQLEYSSGSEDRGRTLFLTYDGRAYDFTVARNSEGKYRFKDRSGVWQYAGYNTWTCN